MKLNKLQIDETHLSLNWELSAEELRKVLATFPELAPVSALIKDGNYQVMVGDEFAPMPTLKPGQIRTAEEPRRQAKPETDADRFVNALLSVVEYRGDWIANEKAPEPRMERTIAAPFQVGGVLRQDLEPWREIIESQTQGVENPALAAVAMLSKKSYQFAENVVDRDGLKERAVEQAKEELRESAYRFYSKTLNQAQVPEEEGAESQ